MPDRFHQEAVADLRAELARSVAAVSPEKSGYPRNHPIMATPKPLPELPSFSQPHVLAAWMAVEIAAHVGAGPDSPLAAAVYEGLLPAVVAVELGAASRADAP